MADPLQDAGAALDPLTQVHAAAGPYLSTLGDRLVRDPESQPLLADLTGSLPSAGLGAEATIEQLIHVGTSAATHSSGPRFYHFVIGGATPAAMAADWLVSLLDQNAAMRASSDFAAAVEDVAIRWLVELFDLPGTFGGALVASATFANFTGLACATHWWGERHGVDIAAAGIGAVGRPMPVLSSGYLHPSARKALQMLGHGHGTAEIFTRDEVGRIDLVALEARLVELDEPAVLIANAGEVNTGDFDPIEAMADLAARYGAWLHVDGAFGLFARLSPRSAGLVQGVERADSIAADAHKWLNVPYESGFAFVREPERLGRAFGMPGAPYLPSPDSPGAGYMLFGPESSRRARALPVWATLRAYGRDGYRAMVERHLDLTRRLADLVDAAPDLERLADAPLCVVCFRYTPGGLTDEAQLNDLNRRLGAALLADGRVFTGSTVYGGRVALRPALTNWRVTARDVEYFVDVVRELGASLLTTTSGG